MKSPPAVLDSRVRYSRPGAKVLFALIFSHLSLSNLQADWAWKSDRAAATLRDGQLVAEFAFHNGGNKPLSVTELLFTCSCMTFTFKATIAEAGGDGSIRIFLPPDTEDDSLVFVAFGSDEATPTPLSIHAPKGAVPKASKRERGKFTSQPSATVAK